MSALPTNVPADYSTRQAVLATVGFADQLGLPIDLDQLHHSLIGIERSLLDTLIAVDELVATGRLARRNDMVCLAGHEIVFDRHADAAQRAKDVWPHAETWAKRVARIPLVRMVAVTGGLAGDALGCDNPIEFFVVVRPRRLWMARVLIARALRVASKEDAEIALAYITTTRNPEVWPQSVPMAWELAHMAVVVGADVARTIRRSNDWIDDLLPNASGTGNLNHHVDYELTLVQRFAEALLLLWPARPIENLIRRRQVAQLRKAAHRDPNYRPEPHAERFSSEVCDELVGARTAAIERALHAAMSTSNPTR